MKLNGIVILIIISVLDPLFDLLIKALEGVASKTTNKIDDKIVAVIKEAKNEVIDFIIDLLKGVKQLQ